MALSFWQKGWRNTWAQRETCMLFQLSDEGVAVSKYKKQTTRQLHREVKEKEKWFSRSLKDYSAFWMESSLMRLPKSWAIWTLKTITTQMTLKNDDDVMVKPWLQDVRKQKDSWLVLKNYGRVVVLTAPGCPWRQVHGSEWSISFGVSF